MYERAKQNAYIFIIHEHMHTIFQSMHPRTLMSVDTYMKVLRRRAKLSHAIMVWGNGFFLRAATPHVRRVICIHITSTHTDNTPNICIHSCEMFLKRAHIYTRNMRNGVRRLTIVGPTGHSRGHCRPQQMTINGASSKSSGRGNHSGHLRTQSMTHGCQN